MSIRKRFTALITALCLVSAINIIPVYSESDEFNYTEFLTDLEIYSEDDNMMYEDDNITREEAASILSVFYGITENSYPVKGVAEDVPENWSSGHISTVLNAGVMSLYDDGLFRPHEFMEVGEVIKMFTVLTGYKIVAENNGGYPSGYLMTAYKCGVVKKSFNPDMHAKITKGEFSRLLYNTLKVNILRQKSYSSEYNEFRSDDDITLLSENLDIYEAEGILKALPYTSLDYSAPLGGSSVKIDNTEYEYEKDAADFLGTSVKIYYRQNDDDDIGTILHMETDENKTEVIKIDADDIENATLTSVTYTKNNKTKTAALPKSAVVIFNGQRNTYYTAKHLMPLQGSVKLIDAQKDGIYEYVIVESYVNYYVKRTERDGGMVYITEKSGKNAIKIDEDGTETYFRVYDRGRETKLDSIKADDIISVMADKVDLDKKEILSGSKQFKIFRSENKVTGRISMSGEDYIVIDGTKYELAGDFDENEYGIKVGEESTFCLNYLGEICAIDEPKAENRFAVLQKASKKKNSSIDDKVLVRLFDESGTFVSAECSDKMQIDGYGKSSYKDAVLYLKNSSMQFAEESGITLPDGSVWQMIKYSLDGEGKVNIIDTVKPDRTSSDNELEYFDTTVSGVNSTWLETAGCLASGSKRFGVSQTTLIFTVGSDKMNDDGYAVKTYASFAPGGSTVAFYNADEMNVAKAAIWYLSGNALSVDEGESQDLMVVEEITNELNSSGTAAVYIRGKLLDNGKDAQIELSEEDLVANHKVVPGSFIRWNAGSTGGVGIIENSMTIDGSGIRANTADPTDGFSKAVRFSYGKAASMDGEYIKLKFSGTAEGKSYEEPWMLDDLKYVYIFDVKNKKLEKGSIDDLRTIDEYGEAEADTIGNYYRWGGLKTMVIYR